MDYLRGFYDAARTKFLGFLVFCIILNRQDATFNNYVSRASLITNE